MGSFFDNIPAFRIPLAVRSIPIFQLLNLINIEKIVTRLGPDAGKAARVGQFGPLVLRTHSSARPAGGGAFNVN